MLPSHFTRQRGRTTAEAARDGADARTVTALDMKHGTLFGTQMTGLLSHEATLRNCGVLHLDVESKHLILDAALF
jgi:hypothetical protein